MILLSLLFSSILLILVSGEMKVQGDVDNLILVKNKRDEFNTSLDLLYPNRHNELLPKDPDDKIMRFFVIGDFGAYMKYRELSAVTEAMNNLAMQYDFNHTVTVGDNLYWFGIENINNRWKAWMIMSAFKKSALRNIMVYPTLGNHDCYVDYFNEVLYSKYDYQWRLENDYYVKITPLKDNPEKQFVNIMLNSCKTICPKENRYEYDNMECKKFSLEPGGKEVDAHYNWIEYQMEKYSQDPKTAWMAVTMHHQPFLHAGMKQVLIPLMKKYGVEIMIVGHAHWLEYSTLSKDHQWKYLESEYGPIKKNCTDKEIFTTGIREMHSAYGEKFHQFTVGSAGALFYEGACPIIDFDGDLVYRTTEQPGVMSAEVTTKLFQAKFINQDGSIGYRVFIHKN